MISISFQAKVSQLVAAGHILLPTTLTEVATYLGTLDTSSLLQAVLKSPAMGETAGDGRGFPVVKLKPGI